MVQEQDPGLDIWAKLFPFEPRRELARRFVTEASELDCVQRIFAMQVGGNNEPHHQRIFIVTSDSDFTIPSPEDREAVIGVWLKVCSDDTARKILGYTPVVTESLFAKDRSELLPIRYRKTTTLWQRGTQTDINPHLN